MLRKTLLTVATLALLAATADAQERRRGARRPEVGALQVGQNAPTFKLKSLDGKTVTDLSAFRGDKPVLLFFGSYT